MATVGQLKKRIAGFFKQSAASFVVDGEDLLLEALNEARVFAEKRHDYGPNYLVAYVDVGADGVSLASAKAKDDDSDVRLKEWTQFYRADVNGTLLPMAHHTRKHEAVWNREQIEFQHYRGLGRDTGRYPARPDSWAAESLNKPPEVYLQGNFLRLSNPPASGTQRIYIDGVKWMDNYTTNENTDFITENGAAYLKWHSIVTLNYMELRFLSGLDGNLPAPTKLRDEELSTLEAWDAFQNHAGRQPKGIR